MAVGAFDLVLDLVAREQRHVVLVELQLPQVLRRHETLHVLAAALEGRRIVQQYFAHVVRQVIAQCAGDRVTFLIDEEGALAVLRGGRDGIPVGTHVVEVPLEFLGGATDAGSAHDGAHTVGNLQRIHRLAGDLAVLAFNTAGDATGTRVVRHQHQEAAGETDERGQGCALVAALFLLDLD